MLYMGQLSSLGCHILLLFPLCWLRSFVDRQPSVTVLRLPRASMYKCTGCLLNKGSYLKQPTER